MSALSAFLKKNKKTKDNVKYAVTKSLTDEAGVPLEWEIRALTTRQDEEIREACTMEVPVKGKPGMYRPRIDTNQYITRMLVESIVEPNLYNAELQDSYGVSTPEDLLKEMVDTPGEYQDLAAFVQKMNGFSQTFEEDIEEAKN